MKKIVFLLLFFFNIGILQAENINNNSSPPHQNQQLNNKSEESFKSKPLSELLKDFFKNTGIYAINVIQEDGVKNSDGKEISKFSQSVGRIIMFIIVFILFYLAIVKKFEPLLLIPIGFGGLLANIPIANMTGENVF